jgi:spore coat polysaccharide biosynthesis protein SpsF
VSVGVVVMARMTSRRFPGKVLHPLAGRPALEYLVERLARAERADTVVVATSTEPSDDPVEALCRRLPVHCHRGPLENVALRLLEAMDGLGLRAGVRVSGDSPLLDQGLVDQAVELFGEGDADLVTNVFPRSFPRGQSVEVINREALQRALASMGTGDDTEHVTPYLYRHPELFRIRNFEAGADHSDTALTIDEPEDAARIEAILARMDRPHWEYSWKEALELGAAVRS